MKLRSIVAFIVIMILMTSCRSGEQEYIVYDGSYSLKIENDQHSFPPNIFIDNGKCGFSYDPLSSYYPHGEYIVEDDKLIMVTDDGRFKYVFRIGDKSLYFVELESSEVKLIDERLGVEIKDGAEFLFE